MQVEAAACRKCPLQRSDQQGEALSRTTSPCQHKLSRCPREFVPWAQKGDCCIELCVSKVDDVTVCTEIFLARVILSKYALSFAGSPSIAMSSGHLTEFASSFFRCSSALVLCHAKCDLLTRRVSFSADWSKKSLFVITPVFLLPAFGVCTPPEWTQHLTLHQLAHHRAKRRNQPPCWLRVTSACLHALSCNCRSNTWLASWRVAQREQDANGFDHPR